MISRESRILIRRLVENAILSAESRYFPAASH